MMLCEVVIWHLKKLIHRVMRIKDTGLLIRKMNGRKPYFIDNTIYAIPGLITIDFEFFEKYQSFGFSRSYGQSGYTFRVLPGRSYMIAFNYESKVVELSELIWKINERVCERVI